MSEHGAPASLTNIAFQTGVIAERERILKLIEAQWERDVQATIAAIKEKEETNE
jgi:hypothetical protein